MSSRFTDNPEVKAHIEALRKRFPDGIKVSDVSDDMGRQYINLVQEGGGVLGIALVGFTYVLEEMNIRFMRLAGTSAGAINTLLLASIGQKHDAKSAKMLEYFSKKDMFDFVDGHSVVRRTLSRLMKNKNYLRDTLLFFSGLIVVLLLSLIANSIHHSTFLSVFIGLQVVVNVLIIVSGIGLLKLFKRSNYGLCKGDNFKQWITDILDEYGITSMSKLREVAYLNYTISAVFDEQVEYHADVQTLSRNKQALPKLKLANAAAVAEGKAADESLKSDITIVTSEITTQRKVELPGMMQMYWKDDTVNPAEFVRASMSIPVFFEPKIIKDIDKHDPNIKDAWGKMGYKEEDIPSQVCFVDGGVISNFPINIFHNPNIRTPRLPVFGLRLMDKDDKPDMVTNKTLATLLYAIFNTVRFNYDKDFLYKNSFYNAYVSHIDVRAYNWLNFAMDTDTQVALFLQGVKAARTFLETFDWADYKHKREQLYDEMNKKQP